MTRRAAPGGAVRCESRRLRLLRLLGDARERGRVVDREIGEALAIEPDAGGLQAADELAVASGR